MLSIFLFSYKNFTLADFWFVLGGVGAFLVFVIYQEKIANELLTQTSHFLFEFGFEIDLKDANVGLAVLRQSFCINFSNMVAFLSCYPFLLGQIT